MEQEEQRYSSTRKRKCSNSHGGKQSRRYTPHQTQNVSPLFDSDYISSSKDAMDLKPSTPPASAEPTQALGQLNIDYSPCRYHLAEEHEVSDTATNITGRSTSEDAWSNISTCFSTDTSMTPPCSPKESLLNDLALASEECGNFLVHCDLLGFINRHYEGNMHLRTLGSVISLSGTTYQAQATTAEKYINQHWPSTGLMLLEALQSAINNRDHTCQVSFLRGHLNVDLDTPKVARVQVKGSRQSVREISCQLEWIGCAFQFSGSGEIEYSTVIKDSSYPSVMKFQLQPVRKERASCWFPLFANSVIALDFPTAHRTNGEKGIEVPFEIMVALAGAQYLVEYEGTTILKGSSCMLVPIQNYHDSIQWHLVSAFELDHIQQRPWLSNAQCTTRVSVQITEMRTKRAFLGWCEKAEICLGTRDIDYRTIDYTKLLQYVTKIRISEFTVSLQIPAGPIGLTLGAGFQFGTRDYNVYNTGRGTLQDVIRQAENTPVVLYDESEKRGWLVPASGVILHMLHTRYHRPAFQREEQLTELIHANPQNGFAAAGIALKESTTVRESTTASHQRGVSFWHEAVFELWDQLKGIRMLHAINVDIGSLVAFPRLLLGEEEIGGWEYMDIVEQNYEIRKKRVVVQNSNGGWVKLARNINCPVVVANGLTEIIRPASGSQCCRSWMRLPTGKDYLGASTTVLQGLYNRAGSSSDYQYLTMRPSRIQWHSPEGSNLFRVCESPCRCKPLQRLVQRAIFTGSISHPKRLEMDGAVIFGYSMNKLQRGREHLSRNINVNRQGDIAAEIPKEDMSSPRSATDAIFDDSFHASESESLTTPISAGLHGAWQKGALIMPPERSLTGDTLHNTSAMPVSETTDPPMSSELDMTDNTPNTPSVQGSKASDRHILPERRPMSDILNNTPLVQDSKVIDRPISPERNPTGDILETTPPRNSTVMDSALTFAPNNIGGTSFCH